jgi:hypothetical protein
MAVLRKVCRNVKRWRDARMALRSIGTAMLEAEKSFRRLKAHKRLPTRCRCAARRQAHCQQKSGSIGFNQWRLLHQYINRHRDYPLFGWRPAQLEMA